MAKRKMIVGPYQEGYLAALNHTVNEMVNEKLKVKMPEVDVNGVFYASMIQAGIEKFEMVGNLSPSIKSEFLQSRILRLPDKNWHDAHDKVEASINRFFPDNDEHNDRHSSIVQLKVFLLDLMLAVQRKSSVVLMQPLPDMTDLQKVIPPELFVAINNLMSSIESESTKLPIPKDYVSPEHFQRFQEVICSDLFRRYTVHHEKFEDGRILKIDAKKEVELMGRTLLGSNRNLLKAKELTVSLIPVTSKIIDIVFGKLPGALSDFFGQQLSTWLKDDRRVVIYQLDPVISELVSRRFKSLAEKKDF